MDMVKIGNFLKELRKEKNLTQEQFAERMGVSGRTISRWETGKNAPDLDVLMEIATYYTVELAEILDGERKSEKMNEEVKESMLKVADYSNEEKMRITKRLHRLFVVGFCTFVAYLLMEIFEPKEPTEVFGCLRGLLLGFSFGMSIIGMIMTSRYASKIVAFKQRMLRRYVN